jgi:hypothetical protein
MLPDSPTDISRSIADVELIPDIEPASDFGTFNIKSEVDVKADIDPASDLRSTRSSADVCVWAIIVGAKLISSNNTTLISDVPVCANADPVNNLRIARSIPEVLLWAEIEIVRPLDTNRSTAGVTDTAEIAPTNKRPMAISAPDVEDRAVIDPENKISETAIKSISEVVLTAAIDPDNCLDII